MKSAAGAVLVLVGTKAQFIKTAPILLAMDRAGMDYRLVYTGQHSETFAELEQVFGVRGPDDVLVPATEADSAGRLVRWALSFWVAALSRVRRGSWRGARWGIVHGDTASTLLSALALRLAGVRVAHVEAGLRSPRLLSPFPEEIIRRLVSRIASLHLAPDAAAAANLRGLGGRVVDTGGNTLRDALAIAINALGRVDSRAGGDSYAIVSLHRSENLGSRRRFDFLIAQVVAVSKVLAVRFVLHPVTRRRLFATGWHRRLAEEPGIELLERMDYVSFVRLMLGARCLLTDGGSNQEEAAMMGLPTLLLRTETERPDGLADGTVQISGLQGDKIREFVLARLGSAWTPRSPQGYPSPSDAIVAALAAEGGRHRR